MPDVHTYHCDECGSTRDVRTYDDPETDLPVDLCESCTVQIFGDDVDVTEGLTNAEADPDETFRDTCITAADYYREGDY